LAKFCPECGKPLEVPGANFCSFCGAVVNPAAYSSSGIQTPRYQKSPILAVACSCLIPGLGQVYNGETGKGFAIFFGALFGLFVLLIPGLIFWFYSLSNAYSTARKMNNGQIPFKPANTIHITLFILIAVVVVIAIYLAIMAFVSSVFQSMTGSDISSLLNNGF
jgi:TM2 domain-containing membrane protein YozV